VLILAANRLRRALEQRAVGTDVSDLDNLRRLAKRPQRAGRRYSGRRVAVAGLFGARCGLQRGAELMVRDLQSRGVEVLAFDFTEALDIRPNIAPIGTSDLARLAAWQPTDLIIHLNPPQFGRVLALFPAALLSSVTVVAYWVWELTVVPLAWGEYAAFVDEIWTPSPFVAQAMAAGLADFPGSIRIVPHAVDSDPMLPIPEADRAALRGRFAIDTDCFIAGTSFSFESNYARKNPCAAIDAFRLAFPDDQRARLIIRCNDAGRFGRLFQHLVSFAGDDPRILIWDTAVVDCPIRAFYGLIDIYVSLHRSEGYGLTLAEAAQAGVRVLATGWSLAPDIARRSEIRTVGHRLVVPLDTQRFYDRYPGALWAEPDLGDAVGGLREAHQSWLARRAAPPAPATEPLARAKVEVTGS
jgi:glycosyltransferase involved in cell wall biosynthesis